MKTKKPQYSLHFKMAALAVLERNNGNLYKTAKEVGVPPKTISDWAKAQREGRLPIIQPAMSDDMSLDEQLDHLARQMVAVMPEKLEEANLHQIIEALKFVLDKVGQAGGDEGADVYEKLAHLINRYAADRPADGDPEPIDESTG